MMLGSVALEKTSSMSCSEINTPLESKSVQLECPMVKENRGPEGYLFAKMLDKRILRFRAFASTGCNGLPTRRRKMLRTIARLRTGDCRANLLR